MIKETWDNWRFHLRRCLPSDRRFEFAINWRVHDMQISINTQVQVDSRLKTSHVGFDRRFIAFGRQPKFSTLHTSSVPSSSLAFFFPSSRPFFLFFFFEADKTNIFQAKSVAVGENLRPSFSKTNHARVCQPFHLGHCPINNDAIRFGYSLSILATNDNSFDHVWFFFSITSLFFFH